MLSTDRFSEAAAFFFSATHTKEATQQFRRSFVTSEKKSRRRAAGKKPRPHRNKRCDCEGCPTQLLSISTKPIAGFLRAAGEQDLFNTP